MKISLRRASLLASLAFVAALCAARSSLAQPAPGSSPAPSPATAPANAPGSTAKAPAARGPMNMTAMFERMIAGFEAEDKANPPPTGAIVLAGDSQLYRWKTLKEDLPDFTIINRGADGFTFPEVLQFMDRTVIPYKPRLIVLHIGGNDVNARRTPEQILGDFKTFVARVHEKLPGTPIAFTSITPSPGRWNQAEVRKQANTLVKDYIATQKDLHFINIWDAFLTADGQPREELWLADRIHPNHEGYKVRVNAMRPFLGKPDKPAAAVHAH